MGGAVWPELAKFHHFCQILNVLGHFWWFTWHLSKFNSALINFQYNWANFCLRKWPNIEQIFLPSGHTEMGELSCSMVLSASSILRLPQPEVLIPSTPSMVFHDLFDQYNNLSFNLALNCETEQRIENKRNLAEAR